MGLLGREPQCFRVSLGGIQIPEINRGKGSQLGCRMNDLSWLTVDGIIARSPYFMPAKDLAEAPLQDAEVQRAVAVNGDGLVVEWRHVGSCLGAAPNFFLDGCQRGR